MSIVQLQHASAVRGGKAVLTDICLALEEGLTAVAGAPGSGKTTLAELACAYRRPDTGAAENRGRVHLASRHAELPEELTLRAGLRLQQGRGQSAEKPGPGQAAAGVIPAEERRRQAQERRQPLSGGTEQLMNRLGLTQAAGAKWRQLTAYQKAAGAIALALAGCPGALVCDDITAGLTDSERLRLLGILAELAEEQKLPVLLISGNEADLAFARRRFRLREGRLEEMTT